ncbi:MAG: pyridoxal-phosphate dependent enzyme [Ignisphaera sp.]|uniref:Pyridoxal-phosphate dependent enzyme n=1 Tax=Ignisphaera aggregans TaxID=334771 RepID=A0A7J3MWC5_9CREN
MLNLVCSICGKEYDNIILKLCRGCGSPLFFVYDIGREKFREYLDSALNLFVEGVWSYRRLLPTRDAGVSLGEGWTPLIEAKNMCEKLGIKIYIKNESLNPNNTFIDRGAAVDVQFAYENKFKSLVTASPGDYSISIASYACVRGIETSHFIPRNIESWKVYRLALTNTSIVFTENYGKALDKAIKQSTQKNHYLSIPLSPTVIDGYRTIVFEILSILKDDVDWISIPVGDGVLASAIYKGVNEVSENLCIESPKILLTKVRYINEESLLDEMSKTMLSELAIEKPLASKLIQRILNMGIMVEVDENDILRALYMLITEEGVFVDPVGVASLAGVVKAIENGVISVNERVVTVLSGSPSKDPYVLYRILSNNTNIKNDIRYLIKREDIYINEIRREILRILYELGEIHMYGIWRELRKRGYVLTLQTLYHHVKYLENLGLVKVIGKDGRRILYMITEIGLEILSKVSS